MPELALGLWAVYYVLAAGVRDVLHRRRTGRSGMVWLRGPARSWAWAGELIEALALGLAVAAPIFDLGDATPRIDGLDRDWLHWAGAGLFLAGLAGVVLSQQAMGASWRVGIDAARTELVTDGPFAVVRNPIFSAIVLVVAGVALMVPNWMAMLAVALMIVSAEIQARLGEEPHLLETHGDGYRRYAASVGRFVPRLGRLRN